MAILVELHGRRFWFLGASFDEAAPLAPLDQCDAAGTLIVPDDWLPFDLPRMSYAHYWPDRGVWRYGKKLGEREDLKRVEAEPCS